jgi:hypothetical protein
MPMLPGGLPLGGAAGAVLQALGPLSTPGSALAAEGGDVPLVARHLRIITLMSAQTKPAVALAYRLLASKVRPEVVLVFVIHDAATELSHRTGN